MHCIALCCVVWCHAAQHDIASRVNHHHHHHHHFIVNKVWQNAHQQNESGKKNQRQSRIILKVHCINLVSPPTGVDAAAWLILGLNRQFYITPALQQLHWLPVKFWIIFTVAIYAHAQFRPLYPLVPQRSRHFLLQWSSSSPTTIVNSKNCHGEPHKNPVWQTCIFCLWTRHLEQSRPTY